jgi:hypothetical protein
MAVGMLMAMVFPLHQTDAMEDQQVPGKSDVLQRGKLALSLLAFLFEKAGWSVRRHPDRGPFQPDLIARRRGFAYAVDVKAGPEGRSDRLVPLVAQAVLQASRAAGRSAEPLAVVAAPRIPRRVAEQVIRFAEDYAPDAAVGVIDFEGLSLFRGAHLEGLNGEARAPSPAVKRSVDGGSAGGSGHLFSDLNQWMLKVLLAPEIPDGLLAAPRGQYRNASQLARAAKVSVMSAFRLVRQLQREGYLHESAPYLDLVRREDLLSRWQGASARSVREAPMRFVLPGDVQAQVRMMLGGGRACLALFAAADALQLGFVQGVPPYVYVHRLQQGQLAAWRSLRSCLPGEPPDVIVREAPAPQSVFRGMVRPEGLAASDVLQIWVDVGAHPARGREQADLIRKRVLGRVIGGGR